MMRSQRGITLVGFVIILAMVGVFAYLGKNVFPI
jgi:Tfp pilus assembly protein PilE